MGHDSDAAIAHGEVGKVGVAIDSIDDMRLLFDGLPLDEVSTSMTINAPAALLLLMYQLVAEENGVPGDKITGTIQNDVLKEYIARGTYIYPPQESLRLITDIFAYCKSEVPRWNTISISGYHMAEAGATPAQEIAFTLADGIEYVRAAVKAGLDVDDFAARLSFFFVSRTTILEEVAKFRAARRIWAQVMRDEFGAKKPKSQMLRFHTQTAGVQLTAQQPEVNLVRVAIQGLAAVLGGTQSLHTNSYDEALALPSEKAARLALRTQQVIAYETDVTKTVDPFAGSYAIESLTDDVEAEARKLMAQVEELGGAVAAIEKGFQKNEIEKAAYRHRPRHRRAASGSSSASTGSSSTRRTRTSALRVDPAIEEQQAERLAKLRAERDQDEVDRHLAALTEAAKGEDNVLYPMKEALRARGHRRRGLQRAARGLGRVRPAGRVLSAAAAAAAGPAPVTCRCRARHRPLRHVVEAVDAQHDGWSAPPRPARPPRARLAGAAHHHGGRRAARRGRPRRPAAPQDRADRRARRRRHRPAGRAARGPRRAAGRRPRRRPWASTVDGRRARLRPRRAHLRAGRRRARAGPSHAAVPLPAGSGCCSSPPRR